MSVKTINRSRSSVINIHRYALVWTHPLILGKTGIVHCKHWRLVVLGIGRENHYRLSEHISRLIIDCTIEMYVPLTLTSEVIKNAQYLTM